MRYRVHVSKSCKLDNLHMYEKPISVFNVTYHGKQLNEGQICDRISAHWTPRELCLNANFYPQMNINLIFFNYWVAVKRRIASAHFCSAQCRANCNERKTSCSGNPLINGDVYLAAPSKTFATEPDEGLSHISNR